MPTPATSAAALIRHYADSTDPDQHTSMADSRIALCIARGVHLEDIDPSNGYDYSRRSYDTVRASWIQIIREHGWSEQYDRHGLDRAHANWAAHRPQYAAGDDWLAAGAAAHRALYPGRTCHRGTCDIHHHAAAQAA